MRHTSESYLQELETRLSLLPPGQREEIMAEYRGHVSAALAEGTPERETLRKFGKPSKVAHQFYTTYGVYERFRKSQYIAVAWLCSCVVGVWAITFGRDEPIGSVPALTPYLWMSAVMIIAPLPYWILTYRCRGQRALPLLIALLIVVLGTTSSQAKFHRYHLATVQINFATLPREESEIEALATVSEPLRLISRTAQTTHSPEMFGAQLSKLQERLEPGIKYLHTNPSSKGRYLMPMVFEVRLPSTISQLNHQAVKFIRTSSAEVAMRAWRTCQMDIDSLVSQTAPASIDYNVGLKPITAWTLIREPAVWWLAGNYFLYVAGVGILFTYLRIPSFRSRNTRAAA